MGERASRISPVDIAIRKKLVDLGGVQLNAVHQRDPYVIPGLIPVRVEVVGDALYRVNGAKFSLAGFDQLSDERIRGLVARDVYHMRQRELLTASADGVRPQLSGVTLTQALGELGAQRVEREDGELGTAYEIGVPGEKPVSVVVTSYKTYEVNGTELPTEILQNVPVEKAMEVINLDIDHVRSRAAILTSIGDKPGNKT